MLSKPFSSMPLYMSVFIGLSATSALAAGTTDVAHYVPTGWRLLSSRVGDLNDDGQKDLVLVLEQTDPAKIKAATSGNDGPLNLNPRRLVILFGTKDSYEVAASSDDFLPSAGSETTPCLADPLSDGQVTIVKGLLKIQLHYELSCGSWLMRTDNFTFRYENQKFRLIGYDEQNFMRNSGEADEYSANYLSGKIKITSGDNEFNEAKPKVSWQTIRDNKPLYLDGLHAVSFLNRED